LAVSTSITIGVLMRLAFRLPRNQVPEWASSYINYKSLKKLVRVAAEAAQSGQEVDLAGMSSR
jgi:glycerophosphodiester phosphodiesterase